MATQLEMDARVKTLRDDVLKAMHAHSQPIRVTLYWAWARRFTEFDEFIAYGPPGPHAGPELFNGVELEMGEDSDLAVVMFADGSSKSVTLGSPWI